jgi:hypothetical protein
MLELQPIDFDEACKFVAEHHRHHLPPQGWKFGIAVNDGEKVVGVITVGRPVARMLDDGWTLEVTRCCTDGTRNAPSMLYGAASRAAFALGYKRLITSRYRASRERRCCLRIGARSAKQAAEAGTGRTARGLTLTPSNKNDCGKSQP